MLKVYKCNNVYIIPDVLDADIHMKNVNVDYLNRIAVNNSKGEVFNTPFLRIVENKKYISSCYIGYNTTPNVPLLIKRYLTNNMDLYTILYNDKELVYYKRIEGDVIKFIIPYDHYICITPLGVGYYFIAGDIFYTIENGVFKINGVAVERFNIDYFNNLYRDFTRTFGHRLEKLTY